jgi:hypothetical protein
LPPLSFGIFFYHFAHLLLWLYTYHEASWLTESTRFTQQFLKLAMAAVKQCEPKRSYNDEH